MVTKEKLYEAFGELIYAVAMADGNIQEEEMTVLNTILLSHKWASDIKWSFNYEKNKSHSVQHAYEKAMDIFKENGPDSEYPFFVEVLQLVADSHKGESDDERKLIDGFVSDLTEKFRADLNVIGQE